MKDSDLNQVLYPRSTTFQQLGESEPLHGQRFTQDTPIMPEVWLAYARDPLAAKARGVLLTPNSESSVRELVTQLRAALARSRGVEAKRVFLAYN